MVAPHHRRTAAARRLGQAEGLGVVEHDDVTGPDPRGHRPGICRHDAFVVPAVGGQQRPVARHAVELVVDPLRDPEEGFVAFDDQPGGVDPGPAGVAEDPHQHLGHPAASGGGVHGPDRAAAEGLPGRLQRREGLGDPAGADDRRQRLDREWPNRNVSHRSSLRRRCP